MAVLLHLGDPPSLLLSLPVQHGRPGGPSLLSLMLLSPGLQCACYPSVFFCGRVSVDVVVRFKKAGRRRSRAKNSSPRVVLPVEKQQITGTTRNQPSKPPLPHHTTFTPRCHIHSAPPIRRTNIELDTTRVLAVELFSLPSSSIGAPSQSTYCPPPVAATAATVARRRPSR